MQELFDVRDALGQGRRHRRQFVRGRAERLFVVGDEVCEVAGHLVQVGHRFPDGIGVVGQQAGDSSQILIQVLQ